ncbi:hypothetical protein LDENG_00208000 [Lucifuga dentata]|nr:hypothetical protein LDENG_00208000 [Lucifuga dentata]
MKIKTKQSNLKTEGLLDKFFKRKTDNHSGSQPFSSQPDARTKTDNQRGTRSQPVGSQPSAKKEEPHETHTFEWCWSDKKPTTFTCDKAGTVEASLKRSPEFKNIAEKNKGKELIIVRNGKAISSHFPCCLIQQDERLTVKYIKAADKPKKLKAGYAYGRKKTKSVIEYGYPLPVIIEQIIIQAVNRGRFDVLKGFLACNFSLYSAVMGNVKKLVESRQQNLAAFKYAAERPQVTADDSLKKFFDFILQMEKPVSMDTD